MTTRGRIRRAVLELMDGDRTVGELVRELRARFPEELRSDAEGYRVVARELAGQDEVEPGEPARTPARTRSGR